VGGKERRRARVDAGAVHTWDLVGESDDEVGVERGGEPAASLRSV
jgi:hypothetical protein